MKSARSGQIRQLLPLRETGSTLRPETATAVPRSLPHFLTTFIDRQAELRSLRTLLHSSRMVTLMGTGGVGKSRLAVEVAKGNQDAWPDGTYWIELVGTDDVTGLLVAMFELPGKGSPLRVVSSWLAGKRVLLILDNCEHVAAECAAVCRALLEECPELTIFATSREPLGVPGEVRWPVSSLSDSDALALFETRAALVAPAFKVAPGNTQTVTEICHRLDGLPLAIEMAAARLDVMSERELLAKLNDRFRVLATGGRATPERQQTMAAAIDWSYRLLTEAEARLFRRLAVFQGSFTLESAGAVGADDGTEPVLPTLAALVQKSMVVADRTDDVTRYRLLESQRAFGLEKLRASGEIEDAQRSHYEYFSSQTWSSRESADFWQAIGWAKANVEDGGLGLALTVADSEFTDPGRARKLLLELLDRPKSYPALRAKALNLSARLASRQNDHVRGRQLADASLAAAREVGDPNLIAQALLARGFVYHSAGELGAPSEMYDEALPLLEASGNRGMAIEVQNQRAWLAIERGDHAGALEMLQECVSFSRAAGDSVGTARFLESLGNAQLGLGDRDGATASWRESLSIFRDLDDAFGIIWSVGGLSLAAAAGGDYERALRLAAVAERISREWSLSALAYRLRQLDDACQRARARLGDRKSDAIWSEGLAMDTTRAVSYALDASRAATAGLADEGLLSKREREVIAMVAAGMTNRQIADRLFIAERTAEGHVERIRGKLGVRSRTEVATWALDHGIERPSLDKV